jgi:hypothetical protein
MSATAIAVLLALGAGAYLVSRKAGAGAAPGGDPEKQYTKEALDALTEWRQVDGRQARYFKAMLVPTIVATLKEQSYEGPIETAVDKAGTRTLYRLSPAAPSSQIGGNNAGVLAAQAALNGQAVLLDLEFWINPKATHYMLVIPYAERADWAALHKDWAIVLDTQAMGGPPGKVPPSPYGTPPGAAPPPGATGPGGVVYETPPKAPPPGGATGPGGVEIPPVTLPGGYTLPGFKIPTPGAPPGMTGPGIDWTKIIPPGLLPGATGPGAPPGATGPGAAWPYDAAVPELSRPYALSLLADPNANPAALDLAAQSADFAGWPLLAAAYRKRAAELRAKGGGPPVPIPPQPGAEWPYDPGVPDPMRGPALASLADPNADPNQLDAAGAFASASGWPLLADAYHKRATELRGKGQPPIPGIPPGSLPGTPHVIREGDIPYLLAQYYVGEGMRWKEIVATTPGMKIITDEQGKTMPSPWTVGHTIYFPLSWQAWLKPVPPPAV